MINKKIFFVLVLLKIQSVVLAMDPLLSEVPLNKYLNRHIETILAKHRKNKIGKLAFDKGESLSPSAGKINLIPESAELVPVKVYDFTGCPLLKFTGSDVNENLRVRCVDPLIKIGVVFSNTVLGDSKQAVNTFGIRGTGVHFLISKN